MIGFKRAGILETKLNKLARGRSYKRTNVTLATTAV
jgi:hypothetical protein